MFRKALAGIAFVVSVALALTGCGGGTKSSASESGSTNTTTTTYSVSSLQILIDGVSGTHVTAGGKVAAKATVMQTVTTSSSTGAKIGSNTSPAVGQIVTFSTGGGTFDPAAGTSLTDANGVAQVVLNLTSAAGAYSITASVGSGSSGSTSGSATLNFLVDHQVEPSLQLSLLTASGNSTQSLNVGDVATVKVFAQQVTQSVGQVNGVLAPAANQPVTLTSDGGTFQPASGKVLTDSNGYATLQFQPNAVQGAYIMSASATIGGATASTSLNYQIQVPQFSISVAVSPATVPAGSPATVTAVVTDPTGQPFTAPLQIGFSSTCSTANSATINSPVPTVGGIASATYRSGQGCTDKDTIKASAILPGQALATSATTLITITQPPAQGITFVSASPATIALKGRGRADLPERSNVTFKVVAATGIGVPGTTVNFALSSQAGGIALISASGVSDNLGNVVATVQSGSVPTSFSVAAALTNGTSVNSSPILISSGAPEQSSFSIAATSLNIEGYNYDGISTQITVRAADHFHNPVPDGTVVSFTASGGSIVPSCTTLAGACTALLTSQAPRPANGRVRVMATAPGDETFIDANGNGLWDVGEKFVDLPEPFRDDNESGAYVSGDFFVDVNGNGRWDGPNGTFDGTTCNQAANCNPKGWVVSNQMTIVFATSAQQITITPDPANFDDQTATPIHVLISDLNGNLPPAGSTVTITASAGKLSGDTSYTIGNSSGSGPLVLVPVLIGDGSTKTGVLTVEVKTPQGILTRKQSVLSETKAPLAVGAIALNPASATIHANNATDITTVATLTTSTTPVAAVPGVTPAIACSQGTSTGLTALTADGAPSPTDANGMTTIKIKATTGATVSGTAQCTITAGSAQTALSITLN